MSPALASNVSPARARGLHRVPKSKVAVSGLEVAPLVRQLEPRFLEGLTPPQLQAVLAAAAVRQYLANSVIINQGHPPEHVFLLLKGRARYFFLAPNGQKLLLLWLPPGEMLGGAALLTKRSHYLVGAEAVRNSCALVWDRATIRGLSMKCPRLFENAFSIAWDYLNVSLATQLSLTCHTARQRVSQVLVNLACGIGHKLPAGVEILISNEDLANAANVTPFTASRLLSDWQRKGLLTKRRGKVLLRDPEGLLLHEV
jgi:CRP/FNR family transcriptional regulator, nitrogen oxide reductase regulator